MKVSSVLSNKVFSKMIAKDRLKNLNSKENPGKRIAVSRFKTIN
jgi:hypothetical protein